MAVPALLLESVGVGGGELDEETEGERDAVAPFGVMDVVFDEEGERGGLRDAVAVLVKEREDDSDLDADAALAVATTRAPVCTTIGSVPSPFCSTGGGEGSGAVPLPNTASTVGWYCTNREPGRGGKWWCRGVRACTEQHVMHARISARAAAVRTMARGSNASKLLARALLAGEQFQYR